MRRRRHAQGRRGGLADRIRAADRRPRPHSARRRARRGPRAGGPRRRRWSSGRRRASPENPGAWLMATAKNRAIDELRRRQMQDRKHDEARERVLRAARAAARPRDGHRRGRRRRPAPAHAHRLPPRPLEGRARRAHAAPARRAHDRRDCPRVPRAGADDRAAHRAGEANARRGARPLRGAARGRSCRRGCPRCSRPSTSSSTRATRPPRATTGRAPRLCEEALRLGRILAELVPQEAEVHGLVALDGDPRVASARARRTPRASPFFFWIRTALAGTSSSSTAGSRRSRAPRRSSSRSVPMRCRPRSPGCHARARTAARDGLEPHRRALRRAGRAHAVTGGRAESRRGRLDGVRACRWARARRRAREGAGAGVVSPSPQRARRPPREARPQRRGVARSSSARPRSRRTPASDGCSKHAPRRAGRGIPHEDYPEDKKRTREREGLAALLVLRSSSEGVRDVARASYQPPSAGASLAVALSPVALSPVALSPVALSPAAPSLPPSVPPSPPTFSH